MLIRRTTERSIWPNLKPYTALSTTSIFQRKPRLSRLLICPQRFYATSPPPLLLTSDSTILLSWESSTSLRKTLGTTSHKRRIIAPASISTCGSLMGTQWLPCEVTQDHAGAGNYIGPQSQKELRSVRRRQLLWELASPYHRKWLDHLQVPDWIRYPLRRLSDNLVQQAADTDCVIHNGVGVHFFVAISLWYDPHDTTAEENESKWLPNAFYLTWSSLLSIQGQIWRFGARLHSKNATLHQAHQSSLPPLTRVRAKWHDEYFCNRKCELNHRYFHKALTYEWLYASQEETFEIIRNKIAIPFHEWINQTLKISLPWSSLSYNGTRECGNTPYYVEHYVIGIYEQCVKTITHGSSWPYSESNFL